MERHLSVYFMSKRNFTPPAAGYHLSQMDESPRDGQCCWNEEIDMKRALSLFALSLIATGLIGLLTLVLTSAAPTLEMRVLAVMAAVLGGYVLVQPLLNRVARRLV
jgi:hypothetical protein